MFIGRGKRQIVSIQGLSVTVFSDAANYGAKALERAKYLIFSSKQRKNGKSRPDAKMQSRARAPQELGESLYLKMLLSQRCLSCISP